MPFFSCYRVILWGDAISVGPVTSTSPKECHLLLMQHDSVLRRQEDAGTDHAFIRKLPVPPVILGRDRETI
jgi:hypothetical protein